MRASGKCYIGSRTSSLASYTLTWPLAICMTLLIALGWNVTRFASRGKASTTPRARLSHTISVHAGGRGSPSINLSDGRDVLTSYSGPRALTHALQQNLAQPLALASADFDEDGVRDLICGYEHSNSGMITLMRGDVNSIYPNGPEAQRNETVSQPAVSPFLSSADVFALPIKPDFLGAGDFNNDDHRDVVAAALEGDSLYLLAGDGKGGFRSAERIPLPGAVTAFVTGEMDRPDGLDDIAIAVAGRTGPKLLVFEGSKGAFQAKPEIIDLTAEATDLELGQLDDGFSVDLAIAAGHELAVVHGRNWNATLNDFLPDQAPPVIITRRSFDFAIRSLAIGDFTGAGDHSSSIALLSEDGMLHLMARENTGAKSNAGTQGGAQWKEVSSPAIPPSISRAATRGVMTTARVSSLPTDDLLLLDPLAHQLHIATNVQLQAGVAARSRREISSLDVEGEPVAVLTMRLNKHALSDLVILRKGKSAPVVALTTPGAIITVNGTADTNTRDTVLTLREAILVANGTLSMASLMPAEQAQVSGIPATPGLDEIRFNIGGGGAQTITPLTPLPSITDPVTIDGYTQPCAQRNTFAEGSNAELMIVLNGSDVKETPRPETHCISNKALTGLAPGPVPAGLDISSGRSVITGLVINNFLGSEIFIEGIGGNVIEGNFIGTDVTGEKSFIENEDLGFGVMIGLEAIQADGKEIATGSPDNSIGGPAPQARNLISGNHTGVFIVGQGSNNNKIQGNYIGTTKGGQEPLGNYFDGVQIKGRLCTVPVKVRNNIVGGTEPGASNVISGNSPKSTSAGLTITGRGATGNLVQGNYMGTTADGAGALGNASEGALINQGAGNNTIGGPEESARNVISGNKHNGVVVGSRNPPPGLRNIIQGNYIGVDKDGTLDLGNFQDGVLISDAGNPCLIAGNVISSNGINPGKTPRGHGVSLGGYFEDEDGIFGGSGSVVADNWIGTDKTEQHDLGNMKNGIYVENNSSIHTIKNNVIAFNKQNGVCIPNRPAKDVLEKFPITTPGVKVRISKNFIFSNAMLEIDLGLAKVTPNHEFKAAQPEANDGQNFPEFTSVTRDGEDTTIRGRLEMRNKPNTSFTIDLFSSTGDASSGCVRRQRPKLIRTISVSTDSSGVASINVVLPVGMAGGFINATATDPVGNTSELSGCAEVSAPLGPELIEISVTSNLVAVGKGFISPVQVFILDTDSHGNTRKLTFREQAKLKPGTTGVQRVVQNGRVNLPDGTSISLEEAVPPGKLVQIVFRNDNGAETVVPFKK